MLTGDSENLLPFPRLEGNKVNVVAFDQNSHLQPLWDAQTRYKVAMGTTGDLIYTYLKYGPFPSFEAFKGTFLEMMQRRGWVQYVVVLKGDLSKSIIVGTIGYVEIDNANRTCEIGNLWLDPFYRGKNIMDEAIYLMLNHTFDVGNYRRVQWTCNNLNEPSKKMALRNQFKFEGVLRNYFITKGVNRDNAVFSIIDSEWDEAKQNLDKRLVN